MRTRDRANQYALFVHNFFVAEDYAYVREEACKKDGSHLERERKAAVVAYRDKQVAEKREKAALKAQKKTEEDARLAGVKQVEVAEDITIDMTAAQLRDQLEIYRKLVDGILPKSHLKTKATMVEALKEAITKYKGIS